MAIDLSEFVDPASTAIIVTECQEAVIEAVNRGYNVVLPRDCVASDPGEFAEKLLKYTLCNLCYITDANTIKSYWG